MTQHPKGAELVDQLIDAVRALEKATDGQRMDAMADRMHAARNAIIALIDAPVRAAGPELLEALKVLAEEAASFNVSGVYFDEACMGHKGLDMAKAAIAKAEDVS